MVFSTGKVIGAIVAGLLLLGAGGWFVLSDNSASYTSSESSSEGAASLESLESIAAPRSAVQATEDRDEDGLRDWEETLWDTDPKNPDTDGDGTQDGEEVAVGRNPAIAGPDDELPQPNTASLRQSVTAYLGSEERTETERLAIEFFTTYSSLRQQGLLNTGAEERALDQLLSGRLSEPLRREYTPAHLTVVTNETPAVLETYRQELGTALANMNEINEYELVTLNRALQQNDREALEKLSFAQAVYNKTRGELLSIRVPQSAAAAHADVINGLVLLSSALGDMAHAFDDPITAVAGVTRYQQSEQALLGAFGALARALPEQPPR